MFTKNVIAIISLIALVLGVSCASGSNVKRIAADEEIDLTGRWNDTDSQQVAEAMIKDSLKRDWHVEFKTKSGKKPVVVVGNIKNRSTEHIDTSLFTKDIERELINSGKISFVANDDEREAIRNERLDQQSEADAKTIKRLGKEIGADFILQGQIASQSDQVEGRKIVLYKIDLELINIETNEKVWIGSKSIKKDISRDKLKL